MISGKIAAHQGLQLGDTVRLAALSNGHMAMVAGWLVSGTADHFVGERVEPALHEMGP